MGDYVRHSFADASFSHKPPPLPLPPPPHAQLVARPSSNLTDTVAVTHNLVRAPPASPASGPSPARPAPRLAVACLATLRSTRPAVAAAADALEGAGLDGATPASSSSGFVVVVVR